MYDNCIECHLLEYCSGRCDVMASLVENNKLTVDREDAQWAKEE
jgi:radical SAM protein with 4Fe4S-binding SPASM domain